MQAACPINGAHWKGFFAVATVDIQRNTVTGKGLQASSAGFTALEMLVTIAIMAIILTIAIPSMTSFLQNSRLASAQGEFVASLNLARSEAATRGVPVVITAAGNTTGNQFGAGWTVWADTNANGVQDAGEPSIRSESALPSAITLGDSGQVTSITFAPSGFLNPATAIQIKLCPTTGNQHGFLFSILPNGLTSTDSNNVTCP